MKTYNVYRISKTEKKFIKGFSSSWQATICREKLMKKIAKEIYSKNEDTFGILGDDVVIEAVAA